MIKSKVSLDYTRIIPRFMLGRLCPIEDVLKIQDELFDRKARREEHSNFFIFAEHDHVYTCNPREKERIERRETKGLLKDWVEILPAPLFAPQENRGGSITYHGPGQIVCYMIIDIAEMKIRGPKHLSSIIDKTIKEALLRFEIQGYTTEELSEIDDERVQIQLEAQGVIRFDKQGKKTVEMAASGIWVITEQREAKKIASRGLKILKSGQDNKKIRAFTKYGFALNVSTDLSCFDYIYPCGLDIRMTSIEELTNGVFDKTQNQGLAIYDVSRLLAEILIRRFREISKKASI